MTAYFTTSGSTLRDRYAVGNEDELRLQSTQFRAGCAHPGVYAQSPSLSVQPGQRIHLAQR